VIRKTLSYSLLLTLGLAACAGNPPAGNAGQKLVQARFATFNSHDLDGIVRLYAPDAIMTSPGFCSPRQGEAGVRKAYGDLFKSYPDISDEVTGSVVQGDHVAVQFIAHVGKYAVPIASFLTLKDGLIVRDDTYFDGQGQHCS
jgi:ketosteroid isomerase-like protein